MSTSRRKKNRACLLATAVLLAAARTMGGSEARSNACDLDSRSAAACGGAIASLDTRIFTAGRTSPRNLDATPPRLFVITFR